MTPVFCDVCMPGWTATLMGLQRSVVPVFWTVDVSIATPWSTRMRIRVKDTGYRRGREGEWKMSVDGLTGGEKYMSGWLTISWATYERKASSVLLLLDLRIGR